MENIPIGGREHDNVVPLPGARAEPPEPDEPFEDEPEASVEEPPDAQLPRLLEDAFRIGIGFVSASAAAVARAYEHAAPASAHGSSEGGEAPAGPSGAAVAAGAFAGLAVEIATAAIRAVESLSDVAGPVLSWIADQPLVRDRVGAAGAKATRLNERWTDARPEGEAIAGAFVAELIPEIARGVLDQLDLTQLVIDRVDLDRVVGSVDLNAVVARLDLDAIVSRIDIDEIVKHVDLDAVIERIDLVGITDRLMEEIDLPELIRQSTGAVTSESVRTVRLQSAEADRLLAQLVDRVLRRGKDRAQ